MLPPQAPVTKRHLSLPPVGVLTVFVDKDHSHFLLLYLFTPLRSLTLLIREVLAGSVFLPSLDYLADPVSVQVNVNLHFSKSLISIACCC